MGSDTNLMMTYKCSDLQHAQPPFYANRYKDYPTFDTQSPYVVVPLQNVVTIIKI